MKLLFTALMFALTTTNVFAQDLPAQVLAEHATTIGWAPEGMVGTYRFQILASGVMKFVDNKGVELNVGNLSEVARLKLVAMIDGIKSDELLRPDPSEPICMDAPSQDVRVKLSSGKTMTVWEMSGCLESTAKDSNAYQAGSMMKGLQAAFSKLQD